MIYFDKKLDVKDLEEIANSIQNILDAPTKDLEIICNNPHASAWKVYIALVVLKVRLPNEDRTLAIDQILQEMIVKMQQIVESSFSGNEKSQSNENIEEKGLPPAPDTKTRPDHYDNGEDKKQIWDYNHVLDGHQANILKYLNRIGKKKGESITDDAKKISAYMEEAYDAKHRTTNIEERIPTSEFETLGHLKLDIMSNIPRYGNPFFNDLLSLILLKKYHDALVKFKTWYQSLKELNIGLQ